MYRRLEGNDCGNKEKENQCLGVDGWILSFMYVRNLLYENRALWCLPMMWAVLFLIIPNVGSFISQFWLQYSSVCTQSCGSCQRCGLFSFSSSQMLVLHLPILTFNIIAQSVPHLEVGSRRPAEFLVELSLTNLFYILVYCFVWIYVLEIFPFLFNKIVSIDLNHPAALWWYMTVLLMFLSVHVNFLVKMYLLKQMEHEYLRFCAAKHSFIPELICHSLFIPSIFSLFNLCETS